MIAIVALALTSARPASAGRAALGWIRMPGAESCIAAAELSRRLEERIGAAVLGSPASAERLVEGRIEPDANRFRAVLVATDGTGAVIGKRELVSPSRSCRSLDEALVLVLALFVDPEGTAAQLSPAEVRVVRVTTVETVEVVPPWSAELSIGAGLAVGTHPSVGPGAEIAFATTPPGSIAFELGADLFTGQDTGSSPGAQVQSAAMRVALCPERMLPRLTARACAGAFVRRYRATGVDLDRGDTAIAFGLGLEARAALRLRLGERLHLEVAVPLAVSLRHPRLHYQRSAAVAGGAEGDSVEVFTPGVLQARVLVGIGGTLF